MRGRTGRTLVAVGKEGHMPMDPVQQREALRRATEVRMRRARLKKDLAGGREHLARVMLDPPAFLLTASILSVLICAREIGEGRARQVLQRVQVSETVPLGQVTERKRRMIVETIAAQLPGVWRAWEAQAA
jgi:hypothetical protein